MFSVWKKKGIYSWLEKQEGQEPQDWSNRSPHWKGSASWKPDKHKGASREGNKMQGVETGAKSNFVNTAFLFISWYALLGKGYALKALK